MPSLYVTDILEQKVAESLLYPCFDHYFHQS